MMRPLNEKERKSAFMQFLILFIITLVLFVLALTLNCCVKKKDVEVWNKKIQAVEKEKEIIEQFSLLVDSIRKEISSLDKLDDSFDIKKGKIINTLLPSLTNGFEEDRGNFENLRVTIKKMSEDWMVDKNKLGQIDELNKTNKKQERQITNLSTYLRDNCDVKTEKLELIKGD